MLKGVRWGAGWRPRRRPRTHGGLIQATALVDRPSDQSIVMSAGRQIRQASKQAKKNKQCGSNPPKGVPQAESHKAVDSASQGGYSWLIANWEQRYATDPTVCAGGVIRSCRCHDSCHGGSASSRLALWALCAVHVAGDHLPAVKVLLIASGHQPEGDQRAENEMDRDKKHVSICCWERGGSTRL